MHDAKKDPLAEVPNYLSAKQLEDMLDEIAGYSVDLAEDPTLPSLGSKYLTAKIAQCRQKTNRVHFYLQNARRYEKSLKIQAKTWELDLEMKMAMMLADDTITRDQPSIDDRKAYAASQLRAEHEQLAYLRVALVDLSDTIRIIKSKYDELKATNRDIVVQRQIVKDDKELFGNTGEGFTKPQTRKDGSVPDGMAPPIRPGRMDPKDLLDPSKRPEDLPEPKDAVHAAQIADFYGAPLDAPLPPAAAPEPGPPPPPPPPPAQSVGLSYDDLIGD